MNLGANLLRLTLWFRYRVTVVGKENLNPQTLSKSGGVLFLPNHPTFYIDPILISSEIMNKYTLRPMVVEYMYYDPMMHWAFKWMDALPMPDFVASSNSLKKKKANKMVEAVIDGLNHQDNFLIYPGAKVKHTAHESVSGSALHQIIHAATETNIVLVRIKGLWGSSFSKALTGSTPDLLSAIFAGIKIVLKNLIFFTPRRPVIIEFVPAPADFPFKGSRLEINRYLEEWYDQPDGLKPTTEKLPGESLCLVSYSMWREDLPSSFTKPVEEQFDLKTIPIKIQENVKRKLSEITEIPIDQILPSQSLSSDLGLDSLDIAEMVVFLDDEYDIKGVPVSEVTSVAKVMAIASKQITVTEHLEENETIIESSKWLQSTSKKEQLAPTLDRTIPESFLNICNRKSGDNAIADPRSGILTYGQAKLRVLLLADYISQLPGKNIGILLPASTTAYLLIFACQLAGKVPVMINWTVGPRHLESVKALSNLEVVLSSWTFLDRLENIDFNGLEDHIILLEDVRRNFKMTSKIKAFYRSKLSTKSILRIFKTDKLDPDSTAALLFTSGTESMPKGVPLSHTNILSNMNSAVKILAIYSDDVFLGMLPCFHAFGFSVSGIFPFLIGCKAIYYPDPTDSIALAKGIQKWSATLLCGAPTFLKGIFKAAEPNSLDTLRLVVSGAEKTPPELFQVVGKLTKCKLLEGYGITECSPVISVNMTSDLKKGVGPALPNVELAVIDLNTHQFLRKNEQGLILVKGPNVFNGYLNKDVKSPFITIDNQRWYNTGDLGFLDDQGNLILSGRLKRFVKIGGEMVSLSSIETALLEILVHKMNNLPEDKGPLLAVCAKEEAGEKTRLYLFTSFNLPLEDANRTLREAGFGNLIKISQVYSLPTIPIMGTGKIHYRELESQLSQLLESKK